MNRLNNYDSIAPRAERNNKTVAFTAKVRRNPFLSCSDKVIDEFFLMLNKLPSPLKEETFVKFCLTGIVNNNFVH